MIPPAQARSLSPRTLLLGARRGRWAKLQGAAAGPSCRRRSWAGRAGRGREGPRTRSCTLGTTTSRRRCWGASRPSSALCSCCPRLLPCWAAAAEQQPIPRRRPPWALLTLGAAASPSLSWHLDRTPRSGRGGPRRRSFGTTATSLPWEGERARPAGDPTRRRPGSGGSRAAGLCRSTGSGTGRRAPIGPVAFSRRPPRWCLSWSKARRSRHVRRPEQQRGGVPLHLLSKPASGRSWSFGGACRRRAE